jgi:hypothetical protein
MKQMVAGPCISLHEVMRSKKRMLQELTAREEPEEILVSKYFKRKEDSEPS